MSQVVQQFSAERAAAFTAVFCVPAAGVNTFAAAGDWTPAVGQVKVSKDGGAPANATNLPTHVGDGIWSLALTASELTADLVVVKLSDSANIDDTALIIETRVLSEVAGTGARTVTITVDDGTDPLESAKVRLTEGANSYFLETDSSGEAVFNLDDVTYTVAITKPGYSFSSTTLTVTADASQTYSMTEESVTAPSDPSLCRLYADFTDLDGTDLANVVVGVRNLFDPSSSSGLATAGAYQEYTANSSGHVEFDVVQGTRIRLSIQATNLTRDVVVPAAATANLLTLLGATTDSFAVVKA